MPNAIELYRQIPAIMLAIVLVMDGGTLLAMGLGVVGEVRSGFCACLGAAALITAVLARGMVPATAMALLFATVACPFCLMLLGMNAMRSRT